MRLILGLVVRIIANLGTMVCMTINILVGLFTLGCYLPMTEIYWLSWKPLMRLRFITRT